jgi:hypothetical protein
MMSKSGNASFDSAMTTAEGVRQAACNAAGASQSTVNSATITFYSTAVTNAVANGLDAGPFIFALKTLGSTP